MSTGFERHRPPRLDARGGARAVRAAVPGADVPRPERPPGAFRSGRGADLDAALDQDRRLPGGLRLLSAERALRHRRQGREADERRRGARPRRAPPRTRARAASAWARPGASRRIATSIRSAPWSKGVRALGLESCATLGMLTERAGAAAQGGRPRLLQPQPRHLAGVLRRDHHHAHLSGPARHARRTCASAGIHVCCGGIVGMGESDEDRAGLIATLASCRSIRNRCRSTCWCRSRARRSRPAQRARSARVRAHHRGRAHHHAEVGGAALGRARGHERRDAGAVLPRRRQLDLLRPEAADDAQSGARPRHAAAGRLGELGLRR